MLEAGEDPLYIARRLVRMASEDIGLADPRALEVAVAAMQAAHFVGMPEGNLALAEAAVYMALAPKSNALYVGYGEVKSDAQDTVAEPVPLHLRNAVTGLMANEGYGKGYQYAHKAPDKLTDMTCLPETSKTAATIAPPNKALRRGCGKRWRPSGNGKTSSRASEVKITRCSTMKQLLRLACFTGPYNFHKLLIIKMILN